MMNIVVVESPAKAKTINKYLGRDYEVLASYGHIRDLPSKDGSVKPDADFSMVWETDPKAQKRLSEIAAAVKGARKLILATDPDREGEAISWHVLEALRARRALKDVAVERVTFNAITKQAVLDAMARPRELDTPLVNAYLARRALDYLVGFTLSPVLWRKLPGARSAGRVQSVALRLICDREMEIEKFRSEEYWTVDVDLLGPRREAFTARLVTLDGRKLKKLDIGSRDAAEHAAAVIRAGRFAVTGVDAKPVGRNPPPPFTTSTLQQEAARKLGFSANRTMQVAQKLYEGVDIGGETVGLITYMRTDGVQMADEAIQAVRRTIEGEFGAAYVPAAPRRYATKAKNAQEAHEAIRPTDPQRLPGKLRLEEDMRRLYELIWKRTMAAQMEAARLERTTIDIEDGHTRTGLRAVGSVVLFNGFLAVYEEGRDDKGDDEDGGRLPKLSIGDATAVSEVKPEQHHTEPPPRYSEASLVKAMEELGIGRPSTYASILEVLRARNYVRMDKNRFIPEDRGRLVTTFLERYFSRYVEYEFTANMEADLDKVSANNLNYLDLLRKFWEDFNAAVSDISELKIGDVREALDEALGPHIFPEKQPGVDPRACPTCGQGRLSLRLGRYGAFIGCSNYPECKFTRQLAPADETARESGAGERGLGTDPATGQIVSLRSGRFGPYVQLGEGETPKRASLPKGWKAEDLDLPAALRLLSLPRLVGLHPEDGEQILANIGRYGPYVQHGKTYANLPGIEDVFEVGLNRAVTVLADKKSGFGRKGAGRAGPSVLKELGAHPRTGEPIRVLNGRYGPYIKHGDVNATLPRGVTPESLEIERALEIIAEREATGGRAGKSARPKAPAKGPAAGRAPAKGAGKGAAEAAGKAPKKATGKTTAKAAGRTGSKSQTGAASPARKARTSKPAARKADA